MRIFWKKTKYLLNVGGSASEPPFASGGLRGGRPPPPPPLPPLNSNSVSFVEGGAQEYFLPQGAGYPSYAIGLPESNQIYPNPIKFSQISFLVRH